MVRNRRRKSPDEQRRRLRPLLAVLSWRDKLLRGQKKVREKSAELGDAAARRSNAKRIRPVRGETASIGYLLIFMICVATVVGAFVFHLQVRFEGIRLGYETSRARAERARLLGERRELRLELASLKAPEKIETQAREKLNMEMPDHNRIVTIGKSKRTVVASGGAH